MQTFELIHHNVIQEHEHEINLKNQEINHLLKIINDLKDKIRDLLKFNNLLEKKLSSINFNYNGEKFNINGNNNKNPVNLRGKKHHKEKYLKSGNKMRFDSISDKNSKQESDLNDLYSESNKKSYDIIEAKNA